MQPRKKINALLMQPIWDLHVRWSLCDRESQHSTQLSSLSTEPRIGTAEARFRALRPQLRIKGPVYFLQLQNIVKYPSVPTVTVWASLKPTLKVE